MPEPSPRRTLRPHTTTHRRLARLAALALAAFGSALAAETDPARLATLSVSVRPARTLCFADRVAVTGTLSAREQVEVGAEREGFKVAQVLANPLDAVVAGQVLARLAPIEGPAEAGALVAVRAPVAGTLLRSRAVIGQPASPRQGPLFDIVAGGAVELVAEVPIPDLARIAVGQTVGVRPLGLPETAGTVRRIESGTEAAAQVGRVRIALTATPDVRIGTFARGIVTVGRRCGVGVPYSAVQYEADGTIVHVVDGTRVEARQVTVGLLSGGNAEIRTGLSEADLVVIRAGAFVREGDQVEPVVIHDPIEPGKAPRAR
ncbi:efflux RND transporter periplasmic adaptor subunit [uncultured Methylobacterium sp.]|uniref:efflux RND transporter periplasmic adaptor subunit n=1 Tax=uncultured Methylobacterium sp. TaxID=157278 RepID=UPI0035CA706A